MADVLKMDPARIARLRDPARLEAIDPLDVLNAVTPLGAGPLVDVGAGVGFATLRLAKRMPDRRIIAADVLSGMLDLLVEDATAKGLGNIEAAYMPAPASLPLPDGGASMMLMVQVHHELDEAVELLRECRRALAPGAPMVIVDWKPDPKAPGGRRVAQAEIIVDLLAAGFSNPKAHDLYAAHSVTSASA